MYTIGMFSKINRITVKTLRHYDEIGLLKPSYVDETTGYRYYSTDQLPRLHKIITLKQMGFSLAEIIAVLDSSNYAQTLKEIMAVKEKEIISSIEAMNSKLVQIQNSLKEMEMKGDGFNMSYNVIIKELPEVIVASKRIIIPGYNAFFDIIPGMGREMEEIGCKYAVPGYCFTIYHDGEYREKDIDVEICQAVTELKNDTETLNFKKLKAVPTAACVLHKGPYSKLGETYAHIFKWISDNGYKIVDHPRESYIDGIWINKGEDDWLTEIQVPVAK